jgi:hypothetical protein
VKAYAHLVQYALSNGHNVSVWDGEEWQVKKSTDAAAIIEAIESVEEAEISITGAADDPARIIGWALVSAYGLQDDETVIDFAYNDYMIKWETAYELAESTPDRDRLIRAARELSTGLHGSFAAGIGDAALRADSHNLQILVNAFPEVFAKATGTETI